MGLLQVFKYRELSSFYFLTCSLLEYSFNCIVFHCETQPFSKYVNELLYNPMCYATKNEFDTDNSNFTDGIHSLLECWVYCPKIRSVSCQI